MHSRGVQCRFPDFPFVGPHALDAHLARDVTGDLALSFGLPAWCLANPNRLRDAFPRHSVPLPRLPLCGLSCPRCSLSAGHYWRPPLSFGLPAWCLENPNRLRDAFPRHSVPLPRLPLCGLSCPRCSLSVGRYWRPRPKLWVAGVMFGESKSTSRCIPAAFSAASRTFPFVGPHALDAHLAWDVTGHLPLIWIPSPVFGESESTPWCTPAAFSAASRTSPSRALLLRCSLSRGRYLRPRTKLWIPASEVQFSIVIKIC